MLKQIFAAALLASSALALTSGTAAAHGCHRHVEKGVYGWHRHVGRDCERVAVSPRHHYNEYREERYHRRAPRCVEKCHYVGPFKECKTICD